MRSRSFLAIFASAISCTFATPWVAVSLAQAPPPKTLPTDVAAPKSGPVTPAAAEAARPRTAAPFDRYRKYDELPELTRELVFATQRGMEWLSRDGIHLPNGRFIPGLNPALGKATDDDQLVQQALAALAMARAAKLTGEEKYTMRAAQSILSLLADTPKEGGQRAPAITAAAGNRVAAAAYLALAIFELPNAAADLRQCGEELCQFIRSRAQADGSIQCQESAADPAAATYPGVALAALAASQRLKPEGWKEEMLGKGLAHYRQQFQTAPQPLLTPWLAAAATDAFASAKSPANAEFVMEMADWLVKLQFASPERQKATWRGGFPNVVDGKVRDTAPTIDTAYAALTLAEACRLIRHMDQPDTGRYDRYSAALTRALQFVATLQYGEENTLHFAAQFRPALVGAFHPSHSDGTLRIDHTAVAVAALSQYLLTGADR